MKYKSTTAFARELKIKSGELFDKLDTLNWVKRKDDKWILTDIGEKNGGKNKTIKKDGKVIEYVAWPENISLDKVVPKEKVNLLNATSIGKHFDISSQRFNLLLNELGWIEKIVAGWRITQLGKSIGGRQFEHKTSGGTYVLWPEEVLTNKYILGLFEEKLPNNNLTQINSKSVTETVNDFRKVYAVEFRTKDGHYVRSKAEMAIDDSLYLWGIPHAYEKKVPNTDENVYSDFHVPSGKGRPKAVYIEYWGMENDEKYNKRKNKKIEIYKSLGLNLIQLNDADIKNLEDVLQKYLRQHEISVSLD